jgi:pentatricopeptide repeat protein
MRVVGINPDVMAYGAILRVCAARGHAERAINLLEEMQQMEVKPTTLCFSSALRAVARSHAIAVRFERGSSERHRRREFLTQHHGNMARSLVVMAENAEVEQDDGFVAALILCAASAGDMGTAKAIYVASEIRRLDQLRTIGSDEHLARLRGERAPELINDEQRLLSSNGTFSNNASIAISAERNMSLAKPKAEGEMRSFEAREYGNDTRTLSGILHACALAVDKKGLGLMWQGRENKGYLCDNSLRLLTARRVPQYTSNSIPGEGTTDNLTWEGEYADVDRKHKLGKRSKFKGVWEDENSAATLDELDESYLKMFVDKEGKLRPEFQKMTPDDLWKLKYGSEEDNDDRLRLPVDEQDKTEHKEKNVQTTSNLYFDTKLMRWVTASVEMTVSETRKDNHVAVKDDLRVAPDNSAETLEEELFFDDTEMRWKTRTKIKTSDLVEKTRFESQILSLDDNDQVSRRTELLNSLPGHLHVTKKHVNDDCLCCFPGSTLGYIETASFPNILRSLYAMFGCFLDNL